MGGGGGAINPVPVPGPGTITPPALAALAGRNAVLAVGPSGIRAGTSPEPDKALALAELRNGCRVAPG